MSDVKIAMIAAMASNRVIGLDNAMPWHQNPTAQTTMTRTDRYKITVDHTTDRGELYDLESDPSETHNLWDDDRELSIKVDMLTRLCHRMAGTVDPLPPRRAAW